MQRIPVLHAANLTKYNTFCIEMDHALYHFIMIDILTRYVAVKVAIGLVSTNQYFIYHEVCIKFHKVLSKNQ